MKTVIIENDLASINHLEGTLDDIGLTTIIGKYTSAQEAEPDILKLRPDLIILEPDLMPVDGLTLAKNIEKEISNIKIIFVTSATSYALGAFDLTQVDFIIKPLEQERITHAIKKLATNYRNLRRGADELVCCFKNLYYVEMHEEDYFKQIDLKWRTKSAKEIFAYLITHQTINVRKDVLIDLFWPDKDLKEAYHNLYTSIYLIRKTLEEAKSSIIINNHDNYYNLDLKNVKLDFEFWLEQIERFKFKDLSKLERVMSLYKGHFLQEESYLWAEYKTQKYRFIWLETMEYIIEQYEKENNLHRAIINALYLQKLEPFLDKTYYILMRLFAQVRDFNLVARQYKRLEEMLQTEYKTKPEKSLAYYLKQ